MDQIMYTESELVRIAKRENNNKRNYLVVNRLQGKHIPVNASEALLMFDKLAEKVQGAYGNERVLFIGFAETATAIGAAVAHGCNGMYMQTTREIIENVDYIFFSEEHSHATEQKLVKDDLDKICEDIDRIVFVEDEVTTGKTILNIINILEQEYPMIGKYAVASILNGMNAEAYCEYENRGIDLHFLVKTDHSGYPRRADKFGDDGEYINLRENAPPKVREALEVEYISFEGLPNGRRLNDINQYDAVIGRLCSMVDEKIRFFSTENVLQRVLVLGTEEFMYPALRVAEFLENKNITARCHSTTRSPIVVNKDKEYPLHRRFELESIYEPGRRTFIYDLEAYDMVFVITDSKICNDDNLLTALSIAGNRIVKVIRC